MARPARMKGSDQHVDETMKRLGDLLPDGWKVTRVRKNADGFRANIWAGPDAGPILIVARDRVEPRDVPTIPANADPVIVASPWLSPRTRELLMSAGISYLDFTGNANITVPKPGLVIRTVGAERDPNPTKRTVPSLRGPQAWALLRTLVEVDPPFGVSDLATVLGTDPGYVSRVLRVLEDELLIGRVPRGPVTTIDWEGVLRLWTSTYALFISNEITTWVASAGPSQFLRDLVEHQPTQRPRSQWAVTGSFAVAQVVSTAPPEVAIVYTSDPLGLATARRLQPAISGANVMLVRPPTTTPFPPRRNLGDLPCVSVAQLAADCLTGSARMPEEGESLLSWMRTDRLRWGYASLEARASGHPR